MTDWKERAERAEAELARLRAQEPEYWQWRRKRDPWEIGKTFNSQVYATTADSEVRCLYAAPPAQPAEQQAQTVCKRTLVEIDARLRECSIVGASAADAYDTFYQHMVETALAAQPAEPVQRLSDEQAVAILRSVADPDKDDVLVPQGDMVVCTPAELARAIESALQPAWRDIESAPKDGRVVLLGKFNSHNKWRTMRGQWFSADAIAETWEDPDDAPEGWYETSVEAEDMPNVWYTEPTHWMPLPPAPKATK